MRFNKIGKSVAISYSIVLVIHILAFLIIPFDKNAADWTAFAFTNISVICSFLIFGYAFRADDSLISKVYGYPIFRLGIIYMVVQFIISIIIYVVGAFVVVPCWIAVLGSIILLGVASIGVIAADNTRDAIENIDRTTSEATVKMTSFKIDIAGIVDRCSDTIVKKELEKLNEDFKYSDPVSSPATVNIESVITKELDILKIMLVSKTQNEILDKITEIKNILTERNRVCKMSKG